ncbi:MAG: DNA replication/repair protein RecF [Clostridia bacterium]|nr:DNA replication/repair protein RecF [Clostridia bacterium]
MYLKSAEFHNFRNINDQSLNFSDGLNILFGKNAQGKTNAVEGIYYFASGRSFRRAKDRDLITFGCPRSDCKILFRDSDREQSMELTLLSTGKKSCRRNGARVEKMSDFVGNFHSVLFCPANLSIVQAEPVLRRQFTDSAISQLRPLYLQTLIELNRLLEQKNALLKNDESELDDYTPMLEVLTEKIAYDSTYLTSVRAKYYEMLFSYVDDLMRDMTGGRESISYEYKSGIAKYGKDLRLESENAGIYYKYCMEHLPYEKKLGTTLCGAQRDDFDIMIDGRSAKTFASQGQQRSIALALKLAEGEISRRECGDYPVFLFDDVLSELDRERKNYVLSRLDGRQVIITSCDESDFDGVDNAVKIRVNAGMYEYC